MRKMRKMPTTKQALITEILEFMQSGAVPPGRVTRSFLQSRPVAKLKETWRRWSVIGGGADRA